MIMRITHGRFDVAREAEIQKLVDEQLIPSLGGRPGFKAYYGGLDRAAATLVAVSVWDTAEQAAGIGSARSPFEELGVQFEPALVFELTATA